ncbi:hypothetical protein [Dongia sp.]|uniref:DUF805 domain-containing protein n=1 Tax=Dongia sp. TaxID=1977262 RepID=UPI0035B003CB
MSTAANIAVAIAVLVTATYFGIARDHTGQRVKRLNYLFAVLFIMLAMWIGTIVVSLVLATSIEITEENFEQTILIMQIVINFLIGIPGLTALYRIVSMRCRDAGYPPRLAYLGAIPLLQLFYFIWLLFPASKAEPVVTSV